MSYATLNNTCISFAENDPYNPFSYAVNFPKFAQRYAAMKMTRESYIPVDFGGGEVARDIRANNNQAVQQQIIQIHQKQLIAQEKAREQRLDKIEKLKAIRTLQNQSHQQEKMAIGLIASEIRDLQSAMAFD